MSTKTVNSEQCLKDDGSTQHGVSVSVVVPVYKTEQYLRQCVDSILQQTFADVEVILVDDGSPDACPEMCDQYAMQDERVHVIHKKNGGLVSAWIAGVNAATGAYIGFVDSDDWIEREMYEKLYEAISQYDADLVQCDFVKEDGGHGKLVCEIDQPYVFSAAEVISVAVPRLLTYWQVDGVIIANSRCNKLFKRNILVDNIGFSDQQIIYGEDLMLTFPVLLDCQRVVCIPGGYYHYRTNPRSITQATSKRDYWEQSLALIDRIQDIARHKRVDVHALLEVFQGRVALKAMINELEAPSPFSKRLSNVDKVRSHTVAAHIPKLRFTKLGRKSKTVFVCHLLGVFTFVKMLMAISAHFDRPV